MRVLIVTCAVQLELSRPGSLCLSIQCAARRLPCITCCSYERRRGSRAWSTLPRPPGSKVPCSVCAAAGTRHTAPLERAPTGRKWRHQHLKRQSQPHLHAARPAHTDEALATPELFISVKSS
uniref:Uncharacterized protein n=1 Tax=Heliothis virescens TaxID=7102 RepID=A0A2A4J3C1_HELVI